MDFAFIEDHPHLMQDNIVKKVKKYPAILQKNRTVSFTEKKNSKSQHNHKEEYDIDYYQNYQDDQDDQNETCSSCNNGYQYNMYDDNVKNNLNNQHRTPPNPDNNQYRTQFNPDNDPRYMMNSSSRNTKAHYLEYN